MKKSTERKIRSRKVSIILMEYMVVLGCLLVAFLMIAGKNIKQTNSYAKPEEVSRYEIVEDEYLTRVRPLTEYSTFKEIAESTLNEEIKVYSDSQKTVEITDGYIKSGMIIECISDEEENNQEYTVSVVGDITKTGDCNVTELTKTIRNIVGLEQFANRLEKLSADFNKDNVINVVDVTMCIRYIVYGELPSDKDVDPEPEPEPEPEPDPEPESINTPEIIVTAEGRENWYRSDVRVQIIEDVDNIDRTITRIEMKLKGEDDTFVQTTRNKEILLGDEGTYTITSQSYGIKGGKSEAVTKVLNIDKTKPELTLSREDIDRLSCYIVIDAKDDNGIVRYAIQKEGEEERSREGINEKEVKGKITITEDGKYKVTIEDIAGNITEKEIVITGVNKNKYIIKFLDENGNIISQREYEEDDIIEIPEAPSKQEDNTYTYEFAEWSPEVEETATENKEYIATYRAIYKNYTVTFKNEDGTIITTKNDYHYGDTIIAPGNPSKVRDNVYTYKFAGWKTINDDVEEIIVETIDETVTKNKEYIATYKETYRNYTVTFKNEDESIITTKNDYHYGDTVTIPDNPSKEQDETYTYEFKGWKNKAGEMIELSEETEVLANEEYTAVYESEYREYTITFWNEDKTQVIARRIFTAEDKEIEEPEISQDREGFIGYWTYYELSPKDIDVQLYYVQEKTNGDSLTETIDGITWRGTYLEGQAINVQYYSGELEEKVRIPSTIEGYPVVNLYSSNGGVSIFKDKAQNVKAVIIPNTVISIGHWAFRNCSNLIEISLQECKEIGMEAFANCDSLTKVNIPKITTIGNRAFSYCYCLQEIDMKKVTSIGGNAFFACNNLRRLEIPNIISIGDNAFYSCYGLRSLEIPNTITNIGESAFLHCENLTDIYIDNESININLGRNWSYNAYVHFRDCTHNITFNNIIEGMHIEEVESNLQDGKIQCGETYKFKLVDDNISEVVKDKVVKLVSDSISEMILPDENGIYTIKEVNRDKYITFEEIQNGEKYIYEVNGVVWQFTYQDGKAEDVHYYDGELGENVQIPSELYGYPVISLYNRSYYGSIFARQSNEKNNTISTVQIPNSVTTIGDYAFRDCQNLSNVNIENGVKNVNYGAFAYCINLKAIEIPNSVTKIGSGVFYGCISLTNIYIDNLEENIELSDDINQYGYVHYSNCKHDIAFEKYTNEEIELQTVGEKGQDGHIECNENYKFKLVDTNGNPVTSEKVLVRYAGLENEIDENERDYYDRVRRMLDNSSNMFASDEEGIRELQVGEDGIYTVEKVHRNITIIVGSYQTTDENNITWKYSIKDGKAVNVYYEGGDLGETVTIPSELDGHQVESIYNKEESGSIFGKAENPEVVKNVIIQNGVEKIGKYAFYKLDSLETIIIPDTVTEIGYASFYNCKELREINIPNSVTKIGGFAFNCCKGLSNIVIPNSVTKLETGTFSFCSNLESIALQSNLEKIPDYLFINCEKLNNIQLPETITSIGNRAFYNCYSIENIIIPDTVTEIKEYAFSGCLNLKSIKLSDSITVLEERLFYDCINITDVNIPNSVTEIKSSVFELCGNIVSIEIPKSVRKIGIAFGGCSRLKDIYIDNNESDITMETYDGNPWYPWYSPVSAQIHYKDCTHSIKLRKYIEDNTGIQSVDESIDNENIPCRSNYQFKLIKDGEAIKNKTITITELGTTKYYDVEKEIEPDEDGTYTIENINRDCIIVIGEKYQQATDGNGITWEYTYEDGKATNVHYYSGELGTDVEIPSTLNGYPVVSLYKEDSNGNPINILGNDWNVYGSVQTITIPEGVTSIGDNAFNNCSNLISVILPDSMEYIGNSVFENCNQLQNINLPDNIKKIGNSTFNNCSSLKSIELPDSLTVIEESLFASCYNLKNVTIKNKVKEIESGAFGYCNWLEELQIPNSVTSIGDYVFNGCYNLSNITISENITEVGSCEIEYTPYYNNLPDGEFYMGKVLYKYKGEMPENTRIIVKEGTEVLRGSVFQGQNNLISIELPDSVTKIERNAFKDCKNLSGITMSKNVEYIGEAAFDGCTSLNEIIIWSNVENLGYRTFDNWKNEQIVNFEVEEVQEGWDKDWNYNCNAQIVFGYTGE